MTETIAPPHGQADSPLDRRQERPFGTSGRSGPVWNPATGEQSGAVDFATVEEIDAAVQTAKEAFTTWRSVSLARRAELFFTIRAARRRAPRGHRALPHPRARQGHLRRARRGRPRPRGDRVRVRHPDPPQGRVLRAGLDRDRRLLDPPAARRRRRDHAVQLPGDGAHVDVGAGDRLREHVRAQALREGSLARRSTRRSCSRRPASRTASSTSSTATRSRSTRCSSTRTSPRSRFVGSTPIARYVYETGDAERQARCRRSAGRRTT